MDSILSWNNFRATFVCCILTIIVSYNLSAQSFAFTVNRTNTACPSNGELMFVSNCNDPAATYIYTATHSSGVVYSTTGNTLQGLPAGLYQLVGNKLLNGVNQTYSRGNFSLGNGYNPIDFTIDKVDVICNGNDGKITVNVAASDLVNLASIEIISGPLMPAPVNGNQFCNLIPGVYRIRANHTLCSDAEPIDVVITTVPAGFRGNVSASKVSCDSLELVTFVSPITGQAIAYPVDVEYTLCPVNGSSSATFVDVISGPGTGIFGIVRNNIPNYNTDFVAKVKFTDRCGNIVEVNYNYRKRALLAPLVGECGTTSFRFLATNVCPPLNVTFCNAPAGFDPANNDFGSTGPFNSTFFTYGSDADPIPFGTYTFKIEDACGYTDTITSFIRTLAPAFSAIARPGCINGGGSLRVFARFDLASVVLTSGPAAYIGGFPSDISECIDEDVLLFDLPPGTYTIDIIDACGNENTRTVIVPALEEEFLSFELIQRCQSFDFIFDHETNGSNPSYRLQKLNGAGNWSFVSTVNPTLTNGSFFCEGSYRIQSQHSNWSKEDCWYTIHEFDVQFNATLEGGTAFFCDDGTIDVYLQASGPHVPYTFCISEIDGVPLNPNLSNSANPVFVGLTPGVYEFLVKDTCDNVTSREFDITSLPGPEISSDLCGDDGSLCFEGHSLLNYRWWEASAPNVILATTECLDFPSISNTAAGTYFLEINFSAINSCINDTMIYVIPSALVDPSAGEDGMIEICESSATLDLFDYLGGTVDMPGTWTVTSGAAAVSGSMVNTSGLAPGTYTFTYSISGECSGMDESMVTLVIFGLEIECKDVKAYLDDTGCVTIGQADVIANNECMDPAATITLSRTKFDCTDLGAGDSCPATLPVITTLSLGGSTATCSSQVTVCDTLPPQILCNTGLTFYVGEPIDPNVFDAGTTDNCSGDLTFITRESYDCSFLNSACLLTRNQIVVVSDECGNTSRCEPIVFVRDRGVPDAVCKDVSLSLDANGLVSITATDLDDGSTDNCTDAADLIFSATKTDFSCIDLTGTGDQCTSTLNVVLTVTDHCGLSSSCNSIITLVDELPPVARCVGTIPLILDANGEASITLADVNNGTTDNCTATGDLNLEITGRDYFCEDLDNGCIQNFTVFLNATDACNNVSSCTTIVTVQDATPPTALCKDVNLILDENGLASITTFNLDAGSFDNCGPLILSTTRTDFSCADLEGSFPGCVTVIPLVLTVTDQCGRTRACNSRVFLRDTSDPIAQCQEITVQLNADGIVDVPPGQLAAGTRDNCTIQSITASQTRFTCADLTGTGAGFASSVLVDVEVADACGNSDECTAQVNLSYGLPCEMQCISQINLSLRATDCAAEVNSNILMPSVDTICNNPIFYTINVFDEHNNVIPDGQVTIDQLDQNLTYEIINNDPSCGNSCWGNILVEYKQLPVIECMDTLYLTCTALEMMCLPSLTGVNATCATNTFEVFLSHEEREKLDCDPDYTHKVTRQYKAKDDRGNEAVCDQLIFVERMELDSIKFPLQSRFTCSDTTFVLDANGYPEPALNLDDDGIPTGVPYICLTADMIGGTGSGTGSGTPGTGLMPTFCVPGMDEQSPYGDHDHDDDPVVVPGGTTGSGTGSGTPINPMVIPLFPGNMDACSGFVTYTDVLISKVNCTTKIMRTWEVREWHCGGEEIKERPQIIELTDDLAPAITSCPAPFELTTNDDCAANVPLPEIIAEDACDNGINVKVEHPWGIVEFVDGVPGSASLETGVHVLTYKVSDDCGNEASCTTTVTIKDNTEPVAICEQNTVVSISLDGNTIVSSEVLDDGSWDECGEVTSCAMKMSDVLRFRSLSVDTMMNGVAHVLRSRMENGCLQEYVSGIELDGVAYLSEDDLCVPYLRFCCTDVGVDQMVIFRAKDHGGNASDCMVNVEVQDKSVPGLTCPEDVTLDCRVPFDMADLGSQFGDYSVIDNCESTQGIDTLVTSDVNQCGTGTILREFSISAFGQVIRSCKQQITLINETPFVYSDINWPVDFTASCGNVSRLTPEGIESDPDLGTVHAKPSFRSGSDNCSLLGYDYEDQYFAEDPLTQECGLLRRTWTVIDWCTQVNGSFVTFDSVQTIKVVNDVAPMISGVNDTILMSTNAMCTSTELFIWAEATDDCTADGQLDYGYEILDGSGSVLTLFADGSPILGTGKDIKGVFGAGEFNVNWSVTDGCGNVARRTQKVTILPSKRPIPICKNGISITLNEYGDAELWVSDIDGGSYHPCGEDLDLELSFEAGMLKDSLQLNCGHLGDNSIRMYVKEVQTGLQDYCTALVVVQDPLKACEVTGVMATVRGEIHTETQHMIEEVKVELSGNVPFAMTDGTGSYAFGQMPMGGDYELTPEKDDDHLAGISTLDLILIQRHILGIEKLESPYKLIAADVNSSEDINGIDLIELRKLILGIYDELPDNTSWRFIDKSHLFQDVEQPWSGALAETYEIIDLSTDMEIDFIGVKVGDVNGDVSESLKGGSLENRNEKRPVTLEYDGGMMRKGEIQSVAFRGRDYDAVLGWQMTLEFDAEKMEVLEVVSKGEGQEHNEKGLSGGWLTMSHHSGNAETKAHDEVLFELVIKANETVYLSEEFELSSAVTPTEAYRGMGEKTSMRLDARMDEETSIISVTPNPWITSTEVEFHIPEAGNGIWEFYDVNGKLIHRVEQQYERGAQVMLLNRTEIEATGVIYVKLTTDQGVAEYKMILVD